MTSARKAEQLQAAADVMNDLVRSDRSSAEIMAILVKEHGARLNKQPWTNTFRFGGLTASCTWSVDKGLIENWRKTATLRLMAACHGGPGAEK